MFTERPGNVRNYLTETLTWETERASNRCLDIALKLTVAYAAVETCQKATGERAVWCAVYLLRYVAGYDPYNFGFKDGTESMGPRETSCPARILDLLTPTDNAWANEWRAACRARLARRADVGSMILFECPVYFTDGYRGSRFTVERGPMRGRRRQKRYRAENGRLYQIRALRDRNDWSVCPPTTATPDDNVNQQELPL